MKTIGLLLLASLVAFGQRVGVRGGGVMRPPAFGSTSGFGNVVFPGTGHAPPINHTGPGIVVRPGGFGGGRLNGVGRSAAYAPYGAYGAYGAYCNPAPRVGAFATQPWDQATPCEPTYGYY